MFSKFIKAIVWVQEEGQKVPYASKVYGEYSVRKDINEISHEDRWIVTHNNSGLSVKMLFRRKDAEILCIKLEENMVRVWDGKSSKESKESKESKDDNYYDFINEMRELL